MESCSGKRGKDVLLIWRMPGMFPVREKRNKKEESDWYDRGTGIGCWTGGNLYDYYLLSAPAAYFVDCRIDYQYFSDSDIHSGTDTYVCSEDHCCICGNDDFWSMDFKKSDRFYC